MSDPIAVTIVEAAPVVVTFGVGEYQPLDSELTALAGLTSAADKLPYYTGSGTAALATFTAAGRAILDDADTAAQRTTLGLGSVNNTSDADKPVSTAQAAADAVVLAAATSGSQPLDADLSAIASLATTTFGRSALTLADASAGRTLYGVVIGTNVQAWDADLDAIAALATTTFGRSALILADAAAGRTLYGVVIGTNVQAFDVDLSALAGLTSAADKLPYFTGSATAALTDFTAAGRALVDDADATAQRVTLGLGNVDNTSDANKPVSTAQAAANVTDRARANHTGTQAWSTLTGTPTTLVGYGITDAQGLDADLTAIASLTTTAYGRSTLELASAAAARTLFGAVIGTNVQAWDADLDAFALKTAPAGAVVGTTDTQTLTGKTLTAPVINNPTGIVKGDVGLGNVDNTSDLNKPVSTAQAEWIADTYDNAVARANHTGTQAFSTITGTVPVSQGGTGVTALPKFSVHKNATDMTFAATNTYYKVPWSTELFDTGGNFASDRFTAPTAAKYTIGFNCTFLPVDGSECYVALYKNGSLLIEVTTRGASGYFHTAGTTVLLDLAANDYLEVYAQAGNTGTIIKGDTKFSYFFGSLTP